VIFINIVIEYFR